MFAITTLMGIRMIITAIPDKTDAPNRLQSIATAIQICIGEDQVIHRYAVASCNFRASTDIKLTISPTVVVLRAALLIVSACMYM